MDRCIGFVITVIFIHGPKWQCACSFTLQKGTFFRRNEDAIIGTLKSSHIWAFNAMLIMGLSKNFTFDFVRELIFENLCLEPLKKVFVFEQDVLMSRSLPCLSVLSLCFFFFIFPFAKKELESVCNCETDFALPKRLFIGKAGWLAAVAIIFQCCCPLRSQGVQPIRVTKGQAHLECCLHSGTPSFVRHHPWIVSHTLEITRPRPSTVCVPANLQYSVCEECCTLHFKMRQTKEQLDWFFLVYCHTYRGLTYTAPL